MDCINTLRSIFRCFSIIQWLVLIWWLLKPSWKYADISISWWCCGSGISTWLSTFLGQLLLIGMIHNIRCDGVGCCETTVLLQFGQLLFLVTLINKLFLMPIESLLKEMRLLAVLTALVYVLLILFQIMNQRSLLSR